ncbi:MAG: hypothetical protein DRP03_03865 [Candidatus Aenigmatarchaeota archaeon]|nr:MAG: hypothetical protein DRP03_03865 [Candidatus Aenigmarchaeota archaeon]
MEGVEEIKQVEYGITERDERTIEYCNGYLTALCQVCQEAGIDEEIISDLIYRMLRNFVYSIKRNILLEDKNE